MRVFKQKMKSAMSGLLISGLVLSSVTSFPVQAQTADITDHLIAHYDFEGTNGTSVPNTVNADQYTGTLSGNNVSVIDNETWGKSLKFTDGEDGQMMIPGIMNTGEKSYSVSMWYKYDTTFNKGTKNTVLLQQNGTGRSLLLLKPDNTYRTFINQQNVDSEQAVDINQWQNVVFVYDSDTQKVKFYVNGTLDSEKSAGSAEVNEMTDLLIGRHKNGGSDPLSMRGLIDEIRIYDKIISAEEAKAIYDLNAVPETPFEPMELTVNPAETERTIDSSSIFGINHRYAFNAYGSFDPETMQVKEDFTKLYEDAGFGSIRYPGGTISNLFNWKTTIGPKETRKKQIHGFYNYSGQGGIAPNFGLGEIASFADSVDSEIVYVYSLGRGNAQDAADLIEYLNAKVGTNPNGGIDWAKVRAENGHEKPYNVRYFEIGNEMQQAYDADGNGSQGYWTTSVPGKGSEQAYTEGGTVSYTKQYAVCEEDWNEVASKSDGSANMVRYIRYANVNPKMYDKDGTIVDDPKFAAVNASSVRVYVGNTEWTLVDNFENSDASAHHAVVDFSTGAIHFGDGIHGAIPAAGAQIYVSYSVERDGFLQISKAMKETTEKINQKEEKSLKANVYTSYESQGFISRMNTAERLPLYDGMTIHPYSGTVNGTNANAFYDDAMLKAENSGIARVQNYVNMLPEGKVPVISEFGIFRNTESQVRSQTHALYIAKTMMEYVRLGSPYIQKHCLVDWYSTGADALGPTQQAVIQAAAKNGADTGTGEGEFAFFATPSAHVFKMLNSGFGDEIIASKFNNVPHMDNGVTEVSALASKDADGNIYVAVVNVDRENDHEIAWNIENENLAGRKVEVQTLASETITDENTLENPEKVKVETSSFTAEETNRHVFPKHSFTVLKINAPEPEKPVFENPFVDVVAGEDIFYYDAVLWAAKNKIVNGTDETHFKPNEVANRAEVVTFLWRVNGCPEPENTESPFEDVVQGKGIFYYDAVLWAVEKGITHGTDETHFKPYDTVTRGEFVTFLHRAAGEPEYTTENPFVDVPSEGDCYYRDGAIWAFENGITKGTDEEQKHFSPAEKCTRAQVVTFLHRNIAE